MSSIIDALKKSDKTRKTDAGQNIDQIKFSDEPPQKSRRGFWLLVTFLLLVALAVLAWQQGWHNTLINQARILFGNQETNQVEAKTKQQNPTNEVLSTSPQQSADNNSSQEQANRSVKKTVTDKGNKLNPPKANEVKAKSLAAEQAKESVKSGNTNERQEQLEVIVNRSTDNELRMADESNQIQPNNAITQSTDNNDSEQSKSEQQIKQNNRKDIEPKLKQDYLLVHQIDFEIRKNIPPIKLNVHIYDPEPENRMVILNGVKYATGESIEDIVTVELINKEGVVLAFEGTKFLIPK